MKVDFVPLLALQRKLYSMPRGRERFEAYLRVMRNEKGDDLELPPLCAMNPMGKEHCATLLDLWLSLDAEEIGASAAADAAIQLREKEGAFKIGLVLVDDLMGGGTNRFTTELSFRSTKLALSPKAERSPRRFWLTAPLWTSEMPTPQAAREAVLMPIFRSVYARERGPACTLREVLAQEGYVMAMSGCTAPVLSPQDLAQAAALIEPHLDAQDVPTLIACLFGDRACSALGYSPIGLGERAGFALALHKTVSQTANSSFVPPMFSVRAR